jgi:hypothetical protein
MCGCPGLFFCLACFFCDGVSRNGGSLRLLTRSKGRWLFVWACFGFVTTTVVSALLWMKEPELPPFDSLGWAWMVVSSVLYVFHIHTGYAAVEFLLGLGLKATGEAAIDCGLAAVAWWTYSVLAREVKTQTTIEKYGTCLLFSACLFGIANNSYFWRSPCADCFAPHGVPFTFFHEGGFAGGEGFVWTGILGNSVVVLVLALVLGLLWSKSGQRTSRENYSNFH